MKFKKILGSLLTAVLAVTMVGVTVSPASASSNHLLESDQLGEIASFISTQSAYEGYLQPFAESCIGQCDYAILNQLTSENPGLSSFHINTVQIDVTDSTSQGFAQSINNNSAALDAINRFDSNVYGLAIWTSPATETWSMVVVAATFEPESNEPTDEDFRQTIIANLPDLLVEKGSNYLTYDESLSDIGATCLVADCSEVVPEGFLSIKPLGWGTYRDDVPDNDFAKFIADEININSITGNTHFGIGFSTYLIGEIPFFSVYLVVANTYEAIAPTAPTNLSFEQEGVNALVASWDAPENEGSDPVSGYSISFVVDGVESGPTPLSANDRTITTYGTIENVDYSFKIYAISEAGNSLVAQSEPLRYVRGVPASMTASELTDFTAATSNRTVTATFDGEIEEVAMTVSAIMGEQTRIFGAYVYTPAPVWLGWADAPNLEFAFSSMGFNEGEYPIVLHNAQGQAIGHTVLAVDAIHPPRLTDTELAELKSVASEIDVTAWRYHYIQSITVASESFDEDFGNVGLRLHGPGFNGKWMGSFDASSGEFNFPYADMAPGDYTGVLYNEDGEVVGYFNYTLSPVYMYVSTSVSHGGYFNPIRVGDEVTFGIRVNNENNFDIEDASFEVTGWNGTGSLGQSDCEVNNEFPVFLGPSGVFECEWTYTVQVGDIGRTLLITGDVVVNHEGEEYRFAAPQWTWHGSVANFVPEAMTDSELEEFISEDHAYEFTSELDETNENLIITPVVNPDDLAWFGVRAHSEPTWLGWFEQENGQIIVPISSLEPGDHNAVIHNPDGEPIGFTPFNVPEVLEPELTVTTTTSHPNVAPKVGETVTLTWTIENTGEANLWDLNIAGFTFNGASMYAVVDDCELPLLGVFQRGDSYSCSYTYVVQLEDIGKILEFSGDVVAVENNDDEYSVAFPAFNHLAVVAADNNNGGGGDNQNGGPNNGGGNQNGGGSTIDNVIVDKTTTTTTTVNGSNTKGTDSDNSASGALWLAIAALVVGFGVVRFTKRVAKN